MKENKLHRILVANRGEIASRIIRSIRDLQLESVAIYAMDDRELPYVSEADHAISLGSGALSQTYLNIELILKIAREVQAEAIHPGYGFLAENAEFAWACKESGIQFIGPTAEAIDLMGNKARARELASKIGVPVLEGQSGELKTLLENSSRLSYPLLIKPSAGGGGKGMRIVHSAEAFEQEAKDASREALKYFGSGELYMERFLEETRHVEVQLMADQLGNMVHLFDRECSVQRRYQKIIEEAPSAYISELTRKRLTSAALKLAREIGYTSAGTVEFLLDKDQNFYFMEMNTRIQVEHPVTELITGLDLVKEQISVAQGEALSFSQDEVVMEGHALEVRLYAEDPRQDFLPSSGTLGSMDLPSRKKVRIDNGYMPGNQVVESYDPLLTKLLVKGKTREDTRKRMIRALEETHITGLHTNRDFLLALLKSSLFKDNKIHTRLLDSETRPLISSLEKQMAEKDRDMLVAVAAFISLYRGKESSPGATNPVSPWQQIGQWRMIPDITMQSGEDSYRVRYNQKKGDAGMHFLIRDREFSVRIEEKNKRSYHLLVNGQLIKVWAFTDQSEIHLDLEGMQFTFRRMDILDRRYIRSDELQNNSGNGEISAPLNGRIVEIPVKEGERVAEGAALVVIESMKMENKIFSEHEAIVKQIQVVSGQQVRRNQILLTLDPL